MKRLQYLLIAFFLSHFIFPGVPAYPQAAKKSDLIQRIENARGERKRELILQLLRQYSPEGCHIIREYESCPDKFKIGSTLISFGSGTDFMQFIRGTSISDIVDDLSTAVHEICHGYTSRYAYKHIQENFRSYPRNNYSAFYVGNGHTILVQHTKTFESRQMAASIPDRLRSNRFSTYINPSSKNQSTQVEGIYGLLDELNAYYHGTRTSVDFFNYFKNETDQTLNDWLQFFSSVNGIYYAHLEFKFYILTYLRYAQVHYPEIYQGIMKNENFWIAFKSIDENFTALIRQYFNLKEAICQRLTEEGYKISEDDEFIIVEKDGHGTGRGNFLKTYKLLQNELEHPEYQALLGQAVSTVEMSSTDMTIKEDAQEMKSIKVAMCQIVALDGDRAGNFIRIENALQEAKQNGAELACFPETCIYGWVNSGAHQRAHPIPGADSDRLCELARKYQLHLAIGLAEKDGPNLHDSAVLIDDRGNILIKHRKINILTSLMTPPYTPGTEVQIAQTNFGKIGLLICADTFKSALLEKMAALKPDLVIVPYGWAAPEEMWPQHGESLVETVTRAAIAIGAPVIGTDLVGEITKGPWTGQIFGGQSVAADGNGLPLAKGEDRDRDIIIFILDL